VGLNPGRGSAITGYRSLTLRNGDHSKPRWVFDIS
jgi:hypothetical protein